MKWSETKNTTSEYVECSLSRDEGEYVEVKTYIQKDRRSETNNQSSYPEKLEQKT